MALPLRDQIRKAYEGSEMSLPELCEKAQLDCTADSLSRKLRDKQSLRVDELEAIAAAMGYRVRLERTRGRRTRAA